MVFMKGADCWARRRRLRSKRRNERDVSLGLVGRSVLRVNMETCVEDVQACGFTIACSCCSNPSFKSCGGADLIGSPDISLLKRKKRSADQGPDLDEAGCHLRTVKYNGDSICIPGNVASMFAVIHQTSGGQCYPLYPLNCASSLQDDVIYYQHVYVALDKVTDTLDALAKAGHLCLKSSLDEGGIKCVI